MTNVGRPKKRGNRIDVLERLIAYCSRPSRPALARDRADGKDRQDPAKHSAPLVVLTFSQGPL